MSPRARGLLVAFVVGQLVGILSTMALYTGHIAR